MRKLVVVTAITNLLALIFCGAPVPEETSQGTSARLHQIVEDASNW